MDKSKFDTINSAINGNEDSINKLIKSEQANIYSMLLYLKKDSEDINDIAQNILIKLYSNITKLKNPLSYKTWLNHIILNTYYDYLRKIKSKKEFSRFSVRNDDDKNIFDIADAKQDLEDKILMNEMDRVIKYSINNLPMHYKTPLTLREIQGLSYKDISDITKTSIGTVKSRIARARDIVQIEIEKYQKS